MSARRSDLLRWIVLLLLAAGVTGLLNAWGFGLSDSLGLRVIAAALCPGVLAVFVLPLENGWAMFAAVVLLNALYYELAWRFARRVVRRLTHRAG